jgi:hypothetical protein
MEQTENQHGDFRVGLKSKKPLKPVHVVEAFVDDRQADNRVDDIGVRMNAAGNAGEQSRAVPNSEEADVLNDVL